MRPARITERLKEPKDNQFDALLATCLKKDWYRSAADAKCGWLRGVYRCPICKTWHRTSRDAQ